jgi:hypothetical protein
MRMVSAPVVLLTLERYLHLAGLPRCGPRGCGGMDGKLEGVELSLKRQDEGD